MLARSAQTNRQRTKVPNACALQQRAAKLGSWALDDDKILVGYVSAKPRPPPRLLLLMLSSLLGGNCGKRR